MLDILYKRSNEGFTKELVAEAVEEVVEGLELGAEAINGGFDTMKSTANSAYYNYATGRLPAALSSASVALSSALLSCA
nr:hypothetical protein CFP56_71432 [Quercus suber]